MKRHALSSQGDLRKRTGADRSKRDRFAVALLGIALTWVPCIEASAGPGLEQRLTSALAAIPHAKTHVGVCVIDIAEGRTIFTRRADEPLVPASTMKLFVMATALNDLGLSFSFETVLGTRGDDLVIVGGGDPGFGDGKLHRLRDESITAHFSRWARALTTHNLTTIAGDLVIDESIFDDQWVHPSWEQSDLDNWYAAPVGGLNFNDNCIDITVRPGASDGAPALVSVVPEGTLVRIVNGCKTGSGKDPVVHHPFDSFEYRIRGKCRKKWTFGSVSFPDPGLLFADSLRTAFANEGVAIDGTIRRERVRLAGGALPESLTVLSRTKTPLADVLVRIGKNSQNLFAECLLKRLGYEWARRSGQSEPQGNWTTGARAVHGFLRTARIDTDGLVVADGSGLSRDNRCTARQLAELLAWSAGQPFADTMRKSLSVAGVDGSLRSRLKDLPGIVFAKTGTMRGVRALAGYVGRGDAPRYAFAVIFNGYKGSSTPYKEIQERMCRALAREDAPASGGR